MPFAWEEFQTQRWMPFYLGGETMRTTVGEGLRCGLTLVETLVLIAIIGVLIGLILPAVQMVRESASRTQCANNLRQLGIAMHDAHDTGGHFPTGGWGWDWVGTPGRGMEPDQPGGWVYNVLPYIEQGNLRQLGLGEPEPQLQASIQRLLETPVPVFNCPSRRRGGPYEVLPHRRTYRVGVGAGGGTASVFITSMARSDYAANCGSQGFNELSGGPATVAEGDSPRYQWPSTTAFTGVFFQRSAVRLAHITRGSSNTLMLGERYLDARHYQDGIDIGDNEGMYVGFDNDLYRATAAPPERDRPGVSNTLIFGSTHAGGANMLYCDGSVRLLPYSIEPAVFRDSGRRAD